MRSSARWSPALALVGFFLTPRSLCGQMAGNVDSSYAGSAGGEIQSCALQPDTRVLIGGYFTGVGSVQRNGVARLNEAGRVQPSNDFNLSIAGGFNMVQSLAVQPDGRILLGGGFFLVAGKVAHGIARVNPDGTAHSLSDARVDKEVSCVAVQPDGKILLGGTFTAINFQPRNRIARLHADGSLEGTDTFNTGGGVMGFADAWVSCLCVQPDGRILVGGRFTDVNGRRCSNLVRLNADGSVESPATFNPGTGPDGMVYCVALQPDGRILLGGAFSRVDGQPRRCVARLLPNGALEDAATFIAGDSFVGENVSSIALQADGGILLAGDFYSLQGRPLNGLARLRPDGTAEDTATFDTGAGGQGIRGVNVLPDGKILLSGIFGPFNGQPRNGLVRLFNDPVSQSLTVLDSRRIQWLRGGSLPEIAEANFEVSTDNGVNWTFAGRGLRIPGGWEAAGLNLPGTGQVRARGRTTGGARNSGTGWVEVKTVFTGPSAPEIAVEHPAGSGLAAGGTKDFGTVLTGTQSSATLVIRNTGTTDLTGLTVTKDGPDADLFSFTPLPSESLSPGSTAGLALQFSSASPGVKTAALHIAGNDADENPFTVYLSGNAVAAAVPDLRVEQPRGTVMAHSETRDFGALAVARMARMVFTVKNEGLSIAGNLTLTKDGPDAALITILTPPATSLPPGAATTFEIGFTPDSPGAKSSLLHLVSDDPDDSPFDIMLTASAVHLPARIALEAVPFGEEVLPGATRNIGTASVGGSISRSFLIQNDGLGDLTGLEITVDGADAGMFTTTPIASSVPGNGGQLTFEVSFTPTSAGGKTAALHIASSDPDKNPFDIFLAGTATGAPPNLVIEQPFGTVLPPGGILDFGTLEPGGTRAVGFTVRNTGEADLTGFVMTITGPDAEFFKRNGSTLENPGTVVPGGSTGYIELYFAPRSPGVKTAVLQLSSNDPDGSPYQLILTGSGTDPTGIADPSFHSPATGSGAIKAVAVLPGGKMLAAGDFQTIAGVGRRHLARLHPDGTLDTSFNPDVTTPPGQIVVLTDGKIILNTSPLSRLLPDGTRDLTFDSPSDLLATRIAPQSDGKYVVLGSGGVYRIHADGTFDIDALLPEGFIPVTMAALADGGALVADTGGIGREVRIKRFNADGSLSGVSTLTGNLNPSFKVHISSMAVLDPVTIAYGGNWFSEPSGTLPNGGNVFPRSPGFDGTVTTIVGQADGKIIAAGSFNFAGGTIRQGLARISTDGTLDETLPGKGTDLSSLVLQGDGKILALMRGSLVRLLNTPAIQVLGVPDAGHIRWFRGGSSPATQDVAMDISFDSGGTWLPLANVQPVAGGWEVAGISLPPQGMIRARARTESDGSSGLVEAITSFTVIPPKPGETWRLLYFGSPANSGAAADLADPDRDGLPNILEFATGGHPLLPTPAIGILTKGAASLEFTYARSKAALAELNYSVEQSPSLSGPWTTSGMTVSTLSDDGFTQRIKATTAASTGRVFVRLRVSRR